MYATGPGVIESMYKFLEIYPKKVENVGQEIVLHIFNPSIVDIRVRKDGVLARFKTNNPVYFLKQRCVTFSDTPPEIFIVPGCGDEDRKGKWEQCARDRARFQRRIAMFESIFTPKKV
jgi:hypothetical protein